MGSRLKWPADMWFDAMTKHRQAAPAAPTDEAIEIVTFRVMEGVTFDDFVEANREVDAWLRLQPGFRSRRIGEQAGRYIVDLLFWASETAARTAMHRLMEDLSDSAVHALIDQATVTWTVAGIRHRQAIDD